MDLCPNAGGCFDTGGKPQYLFPVNPVILSNISSIAALGLNLPVLSSSKESGRPRPDQETLSLSCQHFHATGTMAAPSKPTRVFDGKMDLGVSRRRYRLWLALTLEWDFSRNLVVP